MSTSDNTAALAPPPGVIPNFQHPDKDLNILNLVVQILVMSLVTPFVGLRIYTRLTFQGQFNREDWTCVIAWFFFMLYSISAILMGHFGGGIHQWEVSSDNFTNFLKVVYGGSIIYGLTAYSIKISLLLVFTRVFAPIKSATYGIYAFIFAMLCYYLPIIIIKSRICTPIPSFWDLHVHGTCFNQHALFVADTVISGITDMAVLVIPIPLIWNLQMSFKKKIRVLSLLCAGGVAVIASLVRLVMVVAQGKDPDLTYSIVRFNLLGTAETSIGMICASLPACSAFFARYGSSLFSSKSSKSKVSDAVDFELGKIGSRRSKKARSLPTWVDEDGRSDSDVLVNDGQETGQTRKEIGSPRIDRKGSLDVSSEGEGEIRSAR